ncbi:hypothetical protein ACFYNO_35905 [Kitasatospora sp. NPDC006697]|uniref:hypothetical protein n=1 Tax=Kitasatospora sp. NPDC006697 TaxID=3364020 RepID=UPI0036B7D9C4
MSTDRTGGDPVAGLVASLTGATDRDDAREAAWALLQLGCTEGGAVTATSAAVVDALLASLETGGTPWQADTLAVLDATAYSLGEWAHQLRSSSRPELYERQVAWEREVAEQLTHRLEPVRQLVAHAVPEVRSMAAALLGDAATDWEADLELLLAAGAAEPDTLARACFAEAALRLTARSRRPALWSRASGPAQSWLAAPEAVVRYRAARQLVEGPDGPLAARAARVLQLDRAAAEPLVWPAEV